MLSTAVSNFLTHCKQSQTLSAMTLRSYKSDINDFIRFLGSDVALEMIRGDQLQNYKQHLLTESALKISSVKRRVTALKTLLRWLEERGQIEAGLLQHLDLAITSPRRRASSLFPRARLYH